MKTMRRMKIGGDEGFTLIEMLVSLAILSFGILGVMGLFVTSINGNAQGRNVTEATALAQAKLDRLVSMVDYDNLAPSTETGLKSDETSGGRYTRVVAISENVAALDMKEITVTVTWTTKGFTHMVTLSSLRAKD